MKEREVENRCARLALIDLLVVIPTVARVGAKSSHTAAQATFQGQKTCCPSNLHQLNLLKTV
jgi:hypothetical protein